MALGKGTRCTKVNGKQVQTLKRGPTLPPYDFTQGQLKRENIVSAIYWCITDYSDT